VLIAAVAEALREADVLVFPTARHAATAIGENTMGAARQPFLNRPFNVSGSPGSSVCNGFTTESLPIGFQIGGRPFEDALVLRVGDADCQPRRAYPHLSYSSTPPSDSPVQPIGPINLGLKADSERISTAA